MAEPDATTDGQDESKPVESVRVATFNIRELATAALENVGTDGAGREPSLRAAAEIINGLRPDVLIVQEIDHDYRAPDDLALNARRLRDAYLAGTTDFPYVWTAPCNTGIVTGHDLNNDGHAAGPGDVGGRAYGEDCFGFGQYPGQYSMAVLSHYPIAAEGARTFQTFLWRDLPGNHLPEEFYDPAEIESLRLSSKSHWDVPLEIGGRRLRLWISHPTPAVFDGEEDRNGRRNYDEIAFWKLYLDNDPAIYDDRGEPGGYADDSSFVIVGDLNSDPRSDNAFYDGRQSIDLLLRDARLQDPAPRSDGAEHDLATAVFGGGLRVDYLLPSAEIRITGSGVFWPSAAASAEGARLADEASDHRLVWIDIDVSSLR